MHSYYTCTFAPHSRFAILSTGPNSAARCSHTASNRSNCLFHDSINADIVIIPSHLDILSTVVRIHCIHNCLCHPACISISPPPTHLNICYPLNHPLSDNVSKRHEGHSHSYRYRRKPPCPDPNTNRSVACNATAPSPKPSTTPGNRTSLGELAWWP